MKPRKIKKMIASIAALAMCATIATPVATSFAATVQINNSSTQDAGTEYDVYKIFTFTKSGDGGYKYVVDSAWYPELRDAYGNIETTIPSELPETYPTETTEIEDLNTTLSDWIAELDATKLRKLTNHLAVKTASKTKTTAVWNSNVQGVKATLDDGYYLILDTNSSTNSAKSAPILILADGDATVTLKADKPSIEKKIKEDNKLVDSNIAGYNDVVDYQINAVIPDTQNYKHYTYVITDTLSAGLDLKITTAETDSIYEGYKVVTGGITVKVGEGSTNTPRYTAYYNPDTRILKIVFNSLDMQKLGDEWGHQGDSIIIEYSATVNKEAVVGETGNKNTVKLDYSNDPSASEEGYMGDNDHDGDVDTSDPEIPQDPDDPGQNDPDNPDPEPPTTSDKTDPGVPDDDDSTSGTEKDITLTYTSEIGINKVKANGSSLTGAEFTIVKMNDDKEENIAVVVVKKDGKTVIDSGKATAEVDADGKLKFSGLDEGTYRIYETKIPEGYNGLSGYIEFTLDGTLPTAVADGTEKATWTLTREDTTAGVTKQSSGDFVFEVVNKTGSIFPTTGGIGTTLFYASGIVMLVGAGIIVIVKRKAAES